MRKESVKDRIEQAYFYHYAEQISCVLMGSLPRQDGRWYDYSPAGNHGVITEAAWERLNSGLWVQSFDGTNDEVVVGNIGDIKSVLAWINPADNTTRSLFDLDGGTTSIQLDALGDLTATAFTAPTVYVNAAVATAVTQAVWQMITVTDSTAETANAFNIGHEASFYSGKMALVYVSKDELTAEFIRSFYLNTRHLFGV